MIVTEDVIDRFFEKTIPEPNTGCLLWTASPGPTGYGQFMFDGKPRKAHRMAWLIAYGRWPHPCALHRCDTPGCVNVAHLWEGTVGENNTDMFAKGRAWMIKLTPQDVREIRDERATGAKLTSIAEKYSIDMSTVSAIARRRIWRDVA